MGSAFLMNTYREVETDFKVLSTANVNKRAFFSNCVNDSSGINSCVNYDHPFKCIP